MQELGLDRDEWRDKRQTQGERVGQQNPTLEVQNRAISQLPLAQKVLGFLTFRGGQMSYLSFNPADLLHFTGVYFVSGD